MGVRGPREGRPVGLTPQRGGANGVLQPVHPPTTGIRKVQVGTGGSWGGQAGVGGWAETVPRGNLHPSPSCSAHSQDPLGDPAPHPQDPGHQLPGEEQPAEVGGRQPSPHLPPSPGGPEDQPLTPTDPGPQSVSPRAEERPGPDLQVPLRADLGCALLGEGPPGKPPGPESAGPCSLCAVTVTLSRGGAQGHRGLGRSLKILVGVSVPLLLLLLFVLLGHQCRGQCRKAGLSTAVTSPEATQGHQVAASESSQVVTYAQLNYLKLRQGTASPPSSQGQEPPTAPSVYTTLAFH
ncbi:Hypothetical predicted protein [Marmota monax]|uniref:Uncharacterized protein n=1 Tax=Marmota monax TaxID=9995 RepID=A0A5E4D9V7_MARMO|nr:Hypothetical predicted protein [Marmota monax]